MGYASGFACKRIGRGVLFTGGTIFILLQSLSQRGYVVVDYAKVEQDLMNSFDLDGDGKLTSKDAALAQERVMEQLHVGLPSGSGFTVGFCLGLRA